MSYSVIELRANLAKYILELGIDPRFLENPAFSSALMHIDSLIGQMHMFEEAQHVSVREENGVISFEWNSSTGNRYSFTLSCKSPESFNCIRTEERKPTPGVNGKMFKEKHVIEDVVSIDKFGFITIQTNGAMIDNLNCQIDDRRCNNFTWAERKYYTANGVMRERDCKTFKRGILSESFEHAKVDSILLYSREAYGMHSYNYESRTFLLRDKLDTARIYREDKGKGIMYRSVAQLNQEHGLREMFLLGGYEPYPKNVVIEPLSKEEIELMILNENNPKVEEDLRKYAVGRDTYFYDSNLDSDFVREGVIDSNNMLK